MTATNKPAAPAFEVGDTVFLKGQSDPIVFLTVLNPGKFVDVGAMLLEKQVEVAGFDKNGCPFRFCAPAAALTTNYPG